MLAILGTALAILFGLSLVGFLADKRAERGDPNVTPGLRLLPGDISYQSPSGNFQIHFPIVTAIVLSIVLTLIMRFFT